MKDKVKVRFLRDDPTTNNRRGQITVMAKDGAEMYLREGNGLIEIIDEEKEARKKQAKKIRDKHVIEAVGGMKNIQGEDFDNSNLLGIDKNNLEEIKYEEKQKILQEEKKKTEEENKYIFILKDPKIFDKITIDEFDKQIVGEIATRKTIFLCANGRLVENAQIASYNLLVNSSAGAGKDYVTSKVLKIIPCKEYIKKTRISPTVFTYWHNSAYEPDWNWDGKVFYTEDISESVLNSEVFKVMTSSGSQATIVIKQRAIDIDIKGKPVIITTTATSTPTPELTRRFEFCNLDEGIDQTKEIMKRHSRFAVKGILPDYNLDYTQAFTLLKRVKVKIPYAEKIDPYFPDKNIMMRTKYPRFLDFIKASCAFHQYQRKIDEEGYYLAEEQDYEIAKQVMEKLSSNKYLIPLTLNQQKIMKFFESKQEISANAQEILSQMHNIMALKNFINNLNLLASYGLLEVELKDMGFNKQLETYKLPNYLKESMDQFKLPSFKELNYKEELN